MKTITTVVGLGLFSMTCFAQVNLSTGLVACYPFSGNATDQSGNNHNGIITGATLAPDRNGQPNSAYLFDGTDSKFIDIPNFQTMGVNNEMTVSIWVKANISAGNFPVMLYPDSIEDRLGLAIDYMHSSGNSIFWDHGNIYGTGRQYINPVLFVSQWTHYVFTTSIINNRMRTYKNGALLQEDSTSDYIRNLNRTLRIGGGAWNGAYYNGFIDDIRIYNREVNQAEASALYTQADSVASCNSNDGTTRVSSIKKEVNISAFPNPFTNAVRIEFASTSTFGGAKAEIIDITGRIVTSFNLEPLAGGVTEFIWNGTDAVGNLVNKGIYICKINIENSVKTIRLSFQK